MMEIPEASISCYAVSASSLRCEANLLVPIPEERSAPRKLTSSPNEKFGREGPFAGPSAPQQTALPYRWYASRVAEEVQKRSARQPTAQSPGHPGRLATWGYGARRNLNRRLVARPRVAGPLAGAEAAHHRIHHGLKDGQRVLHRRVDDVEQRIDLADLPATDPRVPDQRLVEQPSLLEEDPVR